MGARNMLNTIIMVYHTHTVASHTTRLHRVSWRLLNHGMYTHTYAYRPVQPLSGSLVEVAPFTGVAALVSHSQTPGGLVTSLPLKSGHVTQSPSFSNMSFGQSAG